jgi:serine/threonine protein kinase
MLGKIAAVAMSIIVLIWIRLLWTFYFEGRDQLLSTNPTPTIVVRYYMLLDADARERYIDQVQQDRINARFLPQMNGRFELWAIGALEIDFMLYNGRQSSLYSIRNDPSLLLKYEADCDEVALDNMHPLLLDFWYGQSAFEVGVGPQNLFVSPPKPIDNSSAIVQRFTMPRKTLNTCVADGGTIRFMVMKRLPSALDLYELQDQFPSGMVPFNLVIRIAISMLSKLQNLHTIARVVHGDIHPGNIMVTTNEPGARVWIIDYGRSRANFAAQSKSPINKPFAWLSLAMSHWQIEGYEWSARDDVYNFIRTLALIMNGDEYDAFEERLKKTGQQEILHWKRFGAVWFVPPEYATANPVDKLHINENRKTEIKQSLGRILSYVRSLNDVDDVVDYAKLFEEFQLCHNLTDPSKNTTV